MVQRMAVSFVAIFAVEAPKLTPPRVVGGVFGDAALPRAAENPPSLLKTRVQVRVRAYSAVALDVI